VRFTEEIEVRSPTTEEAKFLRISEGQPVFEILRVASLSFIAQRALSTTRTEDGQVVEYARGVHAASRFVWSFTYDIPD
jgi:GntR family transcriptional regulator